MSDSVGVIIVRAGRPDDAAALAGLGARPLDELRERLRITPGPDQFILVAEDDAAAIHGYLIAGGARGQSAKGAAEIYALEPAAAAQSCGDALLTACLDALNEARYVAVLWSIPANAAALRHLAEARGLAFVEEGAPGRSRKHTYRRPL